jgi:hypothetical protein
VPAHFGALQRERRVSGEDDPGADLLGAQLDAEKIDRADRDRNESENDNGGCVTHEYLLRNTEIVAGSGQNGEAIVEAPPELM